MPFYGSTKYGQGIYGEEKRPFSLRVILKDNGREITKLLDPRAITHERVGKTYYGAQKYNQGRYTGNHPQPTLLDLTWEYNRIGGCGECDMIVALPYTALDQIATKMEVQIDCMPENGLKYETWYRGEIASRERILSGVDAVNIRADGFVMQLDRVRMDDITYGSTDTGSIVADIIDTYVIPETDIKRTAVLKLIQATEFIVDTITFNGTALEAIRTLAEITGNAEWGVTPDREIYFRIRGETITRAYSVDDFISLSEIEDFSGIKNQYKLFGSGDFVREKGDTASQTAYDKRSAILQQSAIATNDTADQYIDGFLIEKKDPLKTFTGSLSNVRKKIENGVPLGLVKIMNRGASSLTTSTKSTAYQLERITYTMAAGDGVDVQLAGGKLREDIAETLAYFDYRLNQIVDV